MSITFSVYKDGQFLNPEGWVAEFEDDEMYGRCQTNQSPWDINFSNDNTAAIFRQVGLEFDYCGTWDVLLTQDVRSKLALALSIVTTSPEETDGGVEPREVTENKMFGGDYREFDCGLRPGYFADSIARLLVVVEAAINNNAVVTWG